MAKNKLHASSAYKKTDQPYTRVYTIVLWVLFTFSYS